MRGFQFPYITLRIPALFDFGLHDLFFICVSWNLWIKELLDRARRKLCITRCLELAEVQALSQMNDHWPNYSASALGKVCPCVCVFVCGPSFVMGTRGLVIARTALCSFSDTQTLKNTITFIHALMRTMLRLPQPETDTMSSTVSKYLPIFVLKYRQNNSSGAR